MIEAVYEWEYKAIKFFAQLIPILFEAAKSNRIIEGEGGFAAFVGTPSPYPSFYAGLQTIGIRPFNSGKIDDVGLETVLNEIGARGWELVTMLPVTRANGELSEFVAVIKREINS